MPIIRDSDIDVCANSPHNHNRGIICTKDCAVMSNNDSNVYSSEENIGQVRIDDASLGEEKFKNVFWKLKKILTNV